MNITDELKTAQTEAKNARERLTAARADLERSASALAAAETAYAKNPSDAMWSRVDAARAEVDRRTVAARALAPIAEAAEQRSASLEAAAREESARAEREQARAQFRRAVHSAVGRMNGDGFAAPMAKVQHGLASLFEGINEMIAEHAHVATLRARMENEAQALGVPMPALEILPEAAEFFTEVRTMLFGALRASPRFGVGEWMQFVRSPLGDFASPRTIIVNARKAATKRAA